MNLKKWEIASLNKERAAQIAEEYQIPAFLAMMLDIRGFNTDDKIEELLYDDQSFSDPFLMKGMQEAVNRIRQAVDHFEKIAVYGDYDADGITSTAILFTYLETEGADVMYYIPTREGEGYGMNETAVKHLADGGVKLIITVDNGISSVDEIALAKELGIDVIVTDHHRPHEILPDACAIIDAYQEGCTSGFKDFCGAGVALKLIMALSDGDQDIIVGEYADLAAIGTIADIVPLKGENRAIIRAGIDILKSGGRVGVRALMDAAGINPERGLTAKSMAFTLIPRINAVGRMGSPDRAVSLLLSDDLEYAGELAKKICAENDSRRKTEAEITAEVKSIIAKDETLMYDRVLVISGKDWHHGVVGIVAARITENFGKPAIIISESNGEAKGSGRSVEGFSLFDAIMHCEDLLLKCGGHPMAAGITLESKNIDEFRMKINEYAKAVAEEMPAQTIKLDCKLNPATLSPEMPLSLSPLEPFGAENREPEYGLFGMTIKEIIPLSEGLHTKLMCERSGSVIQCLKFGIGPKEFPYSAGDTVDMAVTLDSKEYRGQMQLTIMIKDIKPAEFNMEDAIHAYRLFERYMRHEYLTADEAEYMTPQRDHLAIIYRKAAAFGKSDMGILKLFSELAKQGVNPARILVGLEVLSERGLVNYSIGEEKIRVEVQETDGKKQDIYQSVIFTRIKQQTAV